jgi:diguanylate cyclase (GGDEF)-like protein
LGHLLRQRLRRQDSIGRYGGEEFAAVLPECTVTDALHLINDIRQRLSEIRFDYQGQAFNVTCSAGIASNDVCNGASDLLAAADAALYAAKRAGRNQVHVFTEGPSHEL